MRCISEKCQAKAAQMSNYCEFHREENYQERQKKYANLYKVNLHGDQAFALAIELLLLCFVIVFIHDLFKG